MADTTRQQRKQMHTASEFATKRKKCTLSADRRRSENLWDESRGVQRRRLVDNMPADVRGIQQASNQRNTETATCDVCGAAKTSSEYAKIQWQYRKQNGTAMQTLQRMSAETYTTTVR